MVLQILWYKINVIYFLLFTLLPHILARINQTLVIGAGVLVCGYTGQCILEEVYSLSEWTNE